nr:Chain F, PKC Epsilon pseudo substrate sequence [Homo sapiens]5LIH_G Chain G, PKC Epsilon pseudo substrate sequence [Homo sapiens]
ERMRPFKRQGSVRRRV